MCMRSNFELFENSKTCCSFCQFRRTTWTLLFVVASPRENPGYAYAEPDSVTAEPDWQAIHLSHYVCLEMRGKIIRTVLCCIVFQS